MDTYGNNTECPQRCRARVRYARPPESPPPLRGVLHVTAATEPRKYTIWPDPRRHASDYPLLSSCSISRVNQVARSLRRDCVPYDNTLTIPTSNPHCMLTWRIVIYVSSHTYSGRRFQYHFKWRVCPPLLTTISLHRRVKTYNRS